MSTLSKKDKTKITGKGFEFVSDTHRYYMDGVQMTGITTILSVIAKNSLIDWAARMATEYINKEAPHFYCDDSNCLVGEGTGIKYKGEYYLVSPEILEEAKEAHSKFRDKRAGEGTNTHEEIEKYIKKCIEINNGEPRVNFITTGSGTLHEFHKWALDNVFKFLGSEQKFYSKELFVAGTADFTFLRKDGKRFLGDIKTYKKIWDNIPFAQCAGYALMAEEMGEEPYYGYCIVNLPPEGELECMWNMDIEGDKEAFLAATKLYRFIKKL